MSSSEAQRARQLTVFQSGNPTFDRWQRDVIGILNPFLRALGNISDSVATFNSGSFVDNEVPTGTISGTTGSDGNALFLLDSAPNPPESLILVKSRAVMTLDIDYTLDGKRVTFIAPQIPTAAPLDWLRAWYRK